MKRASLLFLLSIGTAALSFGQNMMMNSNKANGSVTTMMSANPVKADTAMGGELRYAKSTGTKVIFTSLKAAEELAAKQPPVLLFAADWCPYCQEDLKDINANGSRLGDVAVVVANYDTDTELKAKYAITVQDTFLQIDARGTAKAIWNGGGAGVDDILTHIVRS